MPPSDSSATPRESLPTVNVKTNSTETVDVEVTDLLEGIYQAPILPALEEQPIPVFKPWHKPRKHYLRLNQWCSEVRNLIRKLGYREGAVLTYLGLPGEDLLDIRAMQGVCEPASLKLRYLGFNSAARPAGAPYQLNLAEHEVFALNFIHPHSVVLSDQFEKIVDRRSVGLERVRQFEPFDIINIDLCDSLASPAKKAQYFNAIMKLCEEQLRSRGVKPWLMFITTRAGRDEISNDLKSKLLDCVLSNVRANPDFATILISKGFSEASIRAEMGGAASMSDSKLLELFGLAIGKWLLQIMNRPVLPVKVKLLQSYRYRVKNDEPDMLSLAFEIELVISPLNDPTGIAQLPLIAQAYVPTELEQATALLDEIALLRDVDQLLWDDADLRSKIIEKCAKLMAAAHYDPQVYASWAAEWSSSPEKYRVATQASASSVG